VNAPVAQTFLDHGFVAIEGALSQEFCESVASAAFQRMGMVESDRSTWPAGRTGLSVVRNWQMADVAPAAGAAVEELLGGRDVVSFSGVQDNLIVNLPDPNAHWFGADEIAHPAAGWHKDGDWFRHFLDSPEQALLVIVFWRDVAADQGATYVAVDSVGPVARLLKEHPEGLDPAEVLDAVPDVLRQCTDFRALTGRQGTIVFAHPFMLHTASVNATDRPRLISNSSVMLREPMSFARGDGAYNVVERSILRHLGPAPIHYRPSGERKAVSSERERRWKADRARVLLDESAADVRPR